MVFDAEQNTVLADELRDRSESPELGRVLAAHDVTLVGALRRIASQYDELSIRKIELEMRDGRMIVDVHVGDSEYRHDAVSGERLSDAPPVLP
jgi:hypothetical protein